MSGKSVICQQCYFNTLVFRLRHSREDSTYSAALADATSAPSFSAPLRSSPSLSSHLFFSPMSISKTRRNGEQANCGAALNRHHFRRCIGLCWAWLFESHRSVESASEGAMCVKATSPSMYSRPVASIVCKRKFTADPTGPNRTASPVCNTRFLMVLKSWGFEQSCLPTSDCFRWLKSETPARVPINNRSGWCLQLQDGFFGRRSVLLLEQVSSL